MAERIGASGLTWERRRDDLWRVDMPSETREVVRTVVSCGRGVIWALAVLATADDVRPSEAPYR